MSTLDRYLSSEFAQACFAALVVLMMVSLGGIVADVLGEIARGQVPPGLLLSQLGLRVLAFLPLILPLALMLGLMLAAGRLYRDAEMPVLASVGMGPRRLLRPLLLVTVPVLVVIALCSLWLGPLANRQSEAMLAAADRSLLISGLEAGKFIELPGGGGVVYVGTLSPDGRQLGRVFVHRQDQERLDVTTAQTGVMSLDAAGDRFLTLTDGFRVEGPLHQGKDYRLMRYAANDIRLPTSEDERAGDDPALASTGELLADARPQAAAEFHRRLAPPLLALAFALLALPLARSPPRQARHGRILVGFLAYLFATMLMLLGADWLAVGKVPVAAGLWWLLLPLLGLSLWLYWRDGSLGRQRRHAGAKA